MSTRVEIETTDVIFTVVVTKDDMSFNDFMDCAVVPLLKVVYHPATVDKYLNNE